MIGSELLPFEINQDKSVLIIDDHPITQFGISKIISDVSENFNILKSDSIKETKNILKDNQLDICILDLQLPDGNGLDLIDLIRENNNEAKIIVFTGFSCPTTLREVRSKNVEGLLHKKNSKNEFSDCLSTILYGKSYITPYFYDLIEPTDYECPTQMLIDLTDTELQILGLITKGYNTAEISRIRESSVGTVKNHRHNICSKLGLNEKNALILYVLQNKTWINSYLAKKGIEL